MISGNFPCFTKNNSSLQHANTNSDNLKRRGDLNFQRDREMSKKVASTKLLSGLFVAGGVLGMNQVAKADNVVSSEATKPVITTEADNLVVVPTEARCSSSDNRSRSIICRCCDRYCNNSDSFYNLFTSCARRECQFRNACSQ